MNLIYPLLIISPFTLLGQELKRVITTYPNSNYVHEVYHVIADNKGIKQGDYLSFHNHELTRKSLKGLNINADLPGLKEKGKFQNNLKDGIWTTYEHPKLNSSIKIYYRKLEEGQYIRGEKVGIWTTYYNDEKVIKQFDHTNKLSLPIQVRVQLKYPPEARKNRIEGLVTIKIRYENCEPIEYIVIEDIGYGCAESVIESLKEKRAIEKKYDIVSQGECMTKEEIKKVEFRISD